MKTFRSISRFAVLTAIVGISSTVGFAATTTGSATVTSVRGNGLIGDQPAKVNAVVAPGTTLVTGPESTIDLDLKANGPFVRVLPESRLSIDELTSNTDGAEPVISTKLGLKAGKAAGYVKKTSDQSRYIVETPTTTAAIRGTTYLVTAEGEVHVKEGCVNVTYRNINYSVCAGQGFDPKIPGVVELTPAQLAGIPSFPTGLAEQPSRPVGPVINISPVSSGGTTGGTTPTTTGE